MKRTAFILFFCIFSLSFVKDDYHFSALDDTVITYQQLRSGSEKTILFLWTTWCGVCRTELLKSNNCDRYTDDVEVYYVNLAEATSTVERLTERLELKDCVKEKIVLDENGILVEEFKVMFVPTYIFFKNGEPVHKANFISEKLIKEIFHGE